VPHHRRLPPLNWNLHLPAPRPDPGGGVIGEPADDLDRGPVLGGVVGGGNFRVQGRDERQVFGPLTTISTNRSLFALVRSRPFGCPVSTSYPAAQRSYAGPSNVPVARTALLWPSSRSSARRSPAGSAMYLVASPVPSAR